MYLFINVSGLFYLKRIRGIALNGKSHDILQVLNLFLALLLSNFGSSSLSAPTADQETNKIAEAFNRISRFNGWVKSGVAAVFKFLKNKLTSQIADHAPGEPTYSWKQGSYSSQLDDSFDFLFDTRVHTVDFMGHWFTRTDVSAWPR